MRWSLCCGEHFCAMRFRLTLLMWAASLGVYAQFQYALDQSIPVQASSNELAFPWAGGLNGVQANNVDLDGDGQEDLLLYEKSVDKYWTFLRQDNAWKYAPEFESLLPTDVSSFVLLRDYNCDGRKDLFTFNSNVNGISVYQNTTAPGERISFEKVRIYISTTRSFTEILLSKGFTSQVNILPGVQDIPNIADMDGDGDLDILNMRFVNPSTAEYHQNFSMELYGRCDSLVFERQTQRWGDWQECSCGVFAFGTECPSGGRTQHTGGKALLTLDVDNDGDNDVLFSEEQCPRIYLLRNQGNADNPVFTNAELFPTTNPVGFNSFPAPSWADLDFDGVPDLLASPNLNGRVSFSNNFQQSLWQYKNTGSAAQPSFVLSTQDFLQNEMIDVGDNSAPAFADADGDGDLDMFIGSYSSPDFFGRIAFYENTGTASAPAFNLVTNNWLLNDLVPLYNIKPQFADINADGRIDLAFTATHFNTGNTTLYFIPNRSGSALQFSLNDLESLDFNIASTENILLVDVNDDGALDLLIGRLNGAVEFRQNTGGPGSTSSYALVSNAFLGLGPSVARPNSTFAAADLDADGGVDLVIGNQRGQISIIPNFKSAEINPAPLTDIVFDQFSEIYTSRSFGGRTWPAVANLFNANKPAIVVGNATGGLYLLKSQTGAELPDNPVITLFPNPLPYGTSLKVRADRPVSMEVFTIMGQQLNSAISIPANQNFEVNIQNLASGLYIARFRAGSRYISQRFLVLR